MHSPTFQEKIWTEVFGDDYTLRSPLTAKDADNIFIRNYGISGVELYKEFIGSLDRSIKILEVGTNTASQLSILQEMGFQNLCGIEINKKAIEFAKKNTKNIDILYGTALDIPLKDNYFDLVFTAGVLIHISPNNIKQVIKEIIRCSKRYVLGLEYYTDKYTEISYRGNKNVLWKTNFSKLYLDFDDNLELVKEKKLEYTENENKDAMFLLKKKNEIR